MAPDTDTAEHAARREHRRGTLAAAREAGRVPYRYPTDHTAAQIRDDHAGLAPDVRTDARVRIAGRLDLIRRQGGLTFAVLRDRTGTVQLFARSTRSTAATGSASRARS